MSQFLFLIAHKDRKGRVKLVRCRNEELKDSGVKKLKKDKNLVEIQVLYNLKGENGVCLTENWIRKKGFKMYTPFWKNLKNLKKN